ncbi:MAG: hypothetical protein FWD57_16830, partial [Polyangiaceae bacterium]|nr:hypothetical protein [Polyangiaceae bacterium]
MNPLCFSTNNSDACRGSAKDIAAMQIPINGGAVALLAGIVAGVVAVYGGCSKSDEDHPDRDGAPGLS